MSIRDLLDVFAASVAPINLPFTILLLVVIIYWLIVLLGFLDMEWLDSAFGIEGGGDLDGAGAGADAGDGGAFTSALKFLNAGEVPIMVILSFIILCMWAFSILSNHFLNPGDSQWMALGLLLPNVLFGAIATRYLTKPLKRLFGALNRDYDEPVQILGQIGRVITGEISASFGQVEISAKGSPIIIQARAAGGQSLKRGDLALVVAEDAEHSIFQVVKFEQPKLQESL